VPFTTEYFGHVDEISWVPDTAPIKNKMIYASSRESFKNSFVGIQAVIQATDVDEASYEKALEKVERTA
jgi:cofilin